MAKDKVVLEQVERRFGQTTALAALDLTIRDGEFLTMLGPSGCGKTTTLRIIAGLADPTGGRVLIDGRDVLRLPPNKRGVGMVFQNYALFPHLTVADNVGFGLKQHRVPPPERRRRVEELLALVKMQGLGHRYPGELSGGQRQRIAIARAVAYPPAILLMDEPLGALDLKLRESMQQELRGLQRELAITTLYVTHDQTEAMVMSDRIVIMNGGKVEQIGTPNEIYMRPASRFVASFVGRINFLDLDRLRSSNDTAIQLPNAARPCEGAALGIRPEWLEVRPPKASPVGCNAIEGRVMDSIFVGTHSSLLIQLREGSTVAVDFRTGDHLPSLGEEVSVCWRPDQAIVLPAQGQN